MESTNDKQITFRKPIELDHCVISKDEIRVMGQSTVFISHNYQPYVDLKKLNENYIHLVTRAKERNLKVYHRNGIKQTLDLLTFSYPVERKRYESQYALLRLGFTAKVEKGLFSPLSDDLELEGLLDLRNELQALCQSRQSIATAKRVSDVINNRLENIETITQLVL
ncbi:hypothetical protein HUO09_17665 [Vibrio sp. Y2-5]|uniref:hypothetical protein n=1 Tax=Vibrio sp. Y2-5 TaxID=2743977 RepID=UPI001660C62E|nr:hypothetical protein [Vibrio sp. Y2-5]MBD0788186.1 hypothetical protein [Vibrio sp. Y2-5]